MADATLTASGGERLAGLCRLILLLRLATLLITVAYIPARPDQTVPLLAALILATLASVVPLRSWERVAPSLRSHPLWLGGDFAVAVLILVITGTESPFVYYTVATALLGGLLYGTPGAVVFGGALLAAYLAILATELPLPGDLVHPLLVVPALFPLAALAGPMIARALAREQELAAQLADAQRTAAAADERTRLAREMHDTLGKTLHGISLTAVAVAGEVGQNPERAADQARALSGAARTAAAEARELIGSLRSDCVEHTLGAVACAQAQEWSRRAGVAVRCAGEDMDLPDPSARWELLAILREALRNIAEHAGAHTVAVTLTDLGAELELAITDDGVGLPAGHTLEEIEPSGHFGLIGMAERAERVGGRLAWSSTPGSGTTLTARVPRTVERPVPGRQEAGVP